MYIFDWVICVISVIIIVVTGGDGVIKIIFRNIHGDK